ncbi:MAG: hypothetical protein K0S30_175 [Clostridia bacterium]|nr:hypothetical protein [Clostridia bacterium]
MKKEDKNKKKYALLSKQRLHRRVFFIGFFFLSSMVSMAYRITDIKLKNGEDYQKQVLNRMIGKEGVINPQRGAVVDRNSKTIVTSVLSYHVILDPKVILALKEEEKNSIYKALAEQTNQSETAIKEFVESKPQLRYSILSKNLEDEKVNLLKQKKVNGTSLKGVSFEESFTRKYPKGEFAAHLIGFYNKNGQGQYGIEQQYNEALLGKQGRIFSQLQDEQIVTTEIKAAEDGATIVLTIDEVIQQYVETTMKKYIKEYKPINASAIIMNPTTGEVYSMFSYPSFNPGDYNVLKSQLGNDVWAALSDTEKTQKLNDAWKNYNIQYNYEPGSTFKPLLVAAAMDESSIDIEHKYLCTGSKVVMEGQAPIKCWKREGHGEQTLEEVLANSCNVGMIEIGSTLQSETFLKYMDLYGFGNPTGIQLPGEEKGVLHQKLGMIEKATYSIGQGFTCTPVQLITAFSSLINGGYLLQPYVVSSIVDDSDETIYRNKTTIRRQVVSEETSRKVTQYLQKVVDTGTGVNASVNGYSIGGKTGTAQKLPREDEKYILSFIGYAPISNPQVVGLIVFDEIPEHSGVPSRVFQEMMANILPYLEIDLNGSKETKDEQMSKVPQVVNTDIYKASELLAASQLHYEVIGVGKKVIRQYPNEGTQLPKESVVKLYMQTEAPDNLIETPHLQGMTIEEAKLLVGDGFVIEGSGKGSIRHQVPEAGHKVEKNSKIIVQTSE